MPWAASAEILDRAFFSHTLATLCRQELAWLLSVSFGFTCQQFCCYTLLDIVSWSLDRALIIYQTDDHPRNPESQSQEVMMSIVCRLYPVLIAVVRALELQPAGLT